VLESGYSVGMHAVLLPEDSLPATLKLNPDLRMSDDEFFEFCMANPEYSFERTSQGEIIIVPPAGYESDSQSLDAGAQLRAWARKDGRGNVSGATAEFILPTGAAYSPDAAWTSNQRLSRLTKEQRRKFPPVCPEFVIEVMSPTDRLKSAMQKMEEWVRAGVELGWLIRPDKRTVYIYRAGQKSAEQRTGITKLMGEGPVAGFVLDLKVIWAGL
jgi:Uma2 family endonuclease